MEKRLLPQEALRKTCALALGAFGICCTLGIGPVFAAKSIESHMAMETGNQPVFIDNQTQALITGLNAGGFVGAELLGGALLATSVGLATRRENL